MTRSIFFALFLLALAGCAGIAEAPSHSSLPNGKWAGEMTETRTKSDGSEQRNQSYFLLATCNGAVQVWFQDDDGSLYSYGTDYILSSRDSTHLFYFVNAAPKQPDWEEIQTFSFLDLEGSNAFVQWTRAVNNRDVAPSDPKRWF